MRSKRKMRLFFVTADSQVNENVEAYCPKCNKTHTIKTFWTGKTKPRVFCQKCMNSIDKC